MIKENSMAVCNVACGFMRVSLALKQHVLMSRFLKSSVSKREEERGTDVTLTLVESKCLRTTSDFEIEVAHYCEVHIPQGRLALLNQPTSSKAHQPPLYFPI